jgi:hypothetical protein
MEFTAWLIESGEERLLEEADTLDELIDRVMSLWPEEYNYKFYYVLKQKGLVCGTIILGESNAMIVTLFNKVKIYKVKYFGSGVISEVVVQPFVYPPEPKEPV